MHGNGNESGMTPGSRRRFIRTMLASGAALALPDFRTYAASLGTAALPVAASNTSVRLANPYLRAVSSDVLDQLKYAFTAAAAGVPGDANAFAPLCRSYVNSRNAPRRTALRATATQVLARAPAERAALFGRYAATDPTTFLGTDSQLMAVRAGVVRAPAGFNIDSLPPDPDDEFHFADDGFLSDAEIKKKQEQEEHDAALQKDLAAGKPYKHMELRLYEVNITSGTGDGGDHEEVAMAGALIGATGHIAKFKRFLVADDFDTDSDDRQHKKYYNVNGWHLGWFNVNHDKPFPHYYTSQIAMAELDDGGFGDFLIGLWNKLGFIVKGLIDTALSSVLGPIGYVIGELIGAFLDWFIGLFHNDDDILGVKHPYLKFKTHRLTGYQSLGLTEGWGHKKTLKFTGYNAVVGWKLMTEENYQKRKTYIATQAPMYLLSEFEAQ